jgi:chorismate mutase
VSSTTSRGWPDLDEVEKIQQLPADDWTDQDLLTKDEARERLVEEIGRTKARLGQLQTGNSDDEAEIALLSRRLNAMESIRDEYGTYLDGK